MHGMNYIGRFLSNFKDFYNDINAATLTGAIDVIVVEQPDGTYNCSPFHVRFGKLGVLRSREKVVDIEINGEPQDIHMKLGESGEAFFVEEIEDADISDIPEHLATSPIPISEFENLYSAQGRRRNSIDLGKNNALKFENQINDYTKRRNTADSAHQNSTKKREREFLERQIVLGNIDIGENSTEDLTLSLPSNTKISSDDISISKENDYSETIFRMDSLEFENSKSENVPKIDNEPKKEVSIISTKNEEALVTENKSSKKKKRRKSMKKKNSQKKSASVNELSTAADISDPSQDSISDIKTNDFGTDRSSMASSSSDPELKEVQKYNLEGLSNNITKKKTLDPDFHFFSDTELTTTNADSRAHSPTAIEAVLSDTEFEVKNRKDESVEDKGQSWAWGQFPNVSQTNSPVTETSNLELIDQEQQSMLTSMFSFMKQTKQLRHSGTEGIYLADINSVDPAEAALYFSTNRKQVTDADMDCESGNGPSLTQSPNSAEGCKSIDSDFDEHNKNSQNYVQDICLSMCGWDPEPTEESFNKNLLLFPDLCNNPGLIEAPNLVVRMNDKYYTWKVAAPIISSLVIFQRPLPQSTIDQLCSLHMPSSSGLQDKGIKQETRYSWWNWRRSRRSRETTPASDVPNMSMEAVKEGGVVLTEVKQEVEEPELSAIEIKHTEVTFSEKDKTRSSSPQTPPSDKYKKTLRLSSEQIGSLNLRDGMNEVEFSVTTAYQGTTRCKCHLYKWKWDDKIVISDIDGTITKSDVLGHILPIVGKDWAQSGVAQLFNKIKDNGYKLLYLSARAIGQARITRDYLKSIKQGDLSMPDGPVLLNPTSLITAFHREVIEKKPEQFKISCMSDIKALFPTDCNPFYAGYGNRINDVWAYRAVGIPIVRIFTINPKGELKHELTQTFQSTYSNMIYFVDQLFPPLREPANDYSQFVYWREPMPPIEDIELTL